MTELNAATRLTSTKVEADALHDVEAQMVKQMKGHGIDADFHITRSGSSQEILMTITGSKAHFDKAKSIMNAVKNAEHVEDDTSEAKHNVYLAVYSIK